MKMFVLKHLDLMRLILPSEMKNDALIHREDLTLLARFIRQNLTLKVIYHPLYGMNNDVLIWGDWLSCDPLRGSHDSQSPHI